MVILLLYPSRSWALFFSSFGWDPHAVDQWKDRPTNHFEFEVMFGVSAYDPENCSTCEKTPFPLSQMIDLKPRARSDGQFDSIDGDRGGARMRWQADGASVLVDASHQPCDRVTPNRNIGQWT